MNERIQELAEQATKHYPATDSSGEFSTFDKEKFAQLIVGESANYLENEYGKSVITGNDAADFVRKHFGINE